ncbi:hypothetical protein NDU88_006549 [Pleurodeles waltl]|uniref:Uncharacterized protein n=1 Tax=Pleurodeles waltl TaxID=8319 RepID=A0AAV7WAX0_PLEWA|nr:hypothetical protein NDU88_006549 [Pleurodeles waltl]
MSPRKEGGLRAASHPGPNKKGDEKTNKKARREAPGAWAGGSGSEELQFADRAGREMDGGVSARAWMRVQDKHVKGRLAGEGWPSEKGTGTLSSCSQLEAVEGEC